MSPKKKPVTKKKPAAKKPAAAAKKRPGTKAAPKKKSSTGARSGGRATGGRSAGGKGGGKKKAPAEPRMTKGKAKTASTGVSRVEENPRAKAIAQRIAQLLLDKKASEVLILDVRGKTSYADYMVIASGESDRQVTAMAEGVVSGLKEEGTRPVGTEGEETGNWVLLDFGEVVAHLFFSEVRGFYDLEGLWADAPREKVA